jgi:hypothetical protein
MTPVLGRRSRGPEGQQSVAPAVRPGFLETTGTAPEGRKSLATRLLRPSGATRFSCLNPGLTAGATLCWPSGPNVPPAEAGGYENTATAAETAREGRGR